MPKAKELTISTEPDIVYDVQFEPSRWSWGTEISGTEIRRRLNTAAGLRPGDWSIDSKRRDQFELKPPKLRGKGLKTPQPSTLEFHQAKCDLIAKLNAILPAQFSEVVFLRLAGMTLEQIASLMDLTRERIRQIEKRAWMKLKKHGVVLGLSPTSNAPGG